MITTHSVFNKNYVSVLSKNKTLNTVFDGNTYARTVNCCLYLNNMTNLQKYYDNPTNSAYQQSIIQVESNDYHNMSAAQALKVKEYIRSLQAFVNQHTADQKYKYSIYPYSYAQFVKSFYTNLSPVEKKFIFAYLTGKKDNFEPRIHTILAGDSEHASALLLVSKPYSKDEFSKIMFDWKDNYTFQGVKNAMKKIQSIIDLWGHQHEELSDSFQTLWADHQRISKENVSLKDEVQRISKTTWN